MVEVFKGTPIRRMTTGGNYVNLTADVVLLSDYEALRAELEQVKRERDALLDGSELHRDAVCKLVKGDEWVTCGESVVAEYLARDYRWDYQATAESRSLSLALWRHWHDQQKARAEAAERLAGARVVTDEMVKAFQSKYREFWKGSWPDTETSRELLTAALAGRAER